MWDRRFFVFTVVVMVVVTSAGFTGGYMTAARFSDTETKHVTVTANITPSETGTQSAISFVAFCVIDGTEVSASAVNITDVQRDAGGKPVAITYESTVELSTVVVFGGNEFENFDGGTSGTVVFGNGTTPKSAGTGKPGTFEQMPRASCPDGETLVVKFEYDEASGTFVSEAETQSSAATASAETFGVQSVENTSGEDDANDSNATPDSDVDPDSNNTSDTNSTNTSIDTNSTNIDSNADADGNNTNTDATVNSDTDTDVDTNGSADADRNETTTEISVNATHPLENLSSGNETAEPETDE